MDVEDVLSDVVSKEDLRKFEKQYHDQLTTGTVSQETKFHYAWCLVRSNYPADIRKGLILLEQLIKHEANDDEAKRNYLYYLALGNSRIKEYSTALQFIKAFLHMQPENMQAQNLLETIKKKMESDAHKGMAVAGALALGLSAVVGIGFALAKGLKK
ncbi:mitochondrial fission 1 protein [Melanaphis sacchari]|uniref:Mitochondrial fission 1 protein n=1 Tax=Melanaphis sacchari TaxID=742174 RepID=A0A2H8TV28_9HEMI|nr:mitochondrial fission 1 protein [Melanaphis sacchari]XP_025206168.1 mitochondrial fission 1 protein [Melanaphis sacchari]XP_025206169.1 mitochondrial fission 1 protein [Melanaphis sacchari]